MPQNFDLIGTAFRAMTYFVPFLFALCFHEFAHGWVARMRGDNTAEMAGRLTMNPMAHADLIGTVILPLLAITTGFPFFGWAKPVPVNERNLKNPRVDMFWIAFAGPLSNLLLALVGALGLGLFVRAFASMLISENGGGLEIVNVMKIFITVNVFLAVFNMLPFYPLDGAKVIARFLPDKVNRQMEAWSGYSSMILLFVFWSGGLALISAPAVWVSNLFLSLAQGVIGA
jgi:Zn-dependent protease